MECRKPDFEQGLYTYKDSLAWDEAERWELFDGALNEDTKSKPCQILPGIAVRLFSEPDGSDKTFFVSDIVVVCGKEQLTEQVCLGPPALVIEILSPFTASNDMVYKLNKYLKAGVREYWVVDPAQKLVSVFILDGASYRTAVYGPKYTPELGVSSLPGCRVNLGAVFG